MNESQQSLEDFRSIYCRWSSVADLTHIGTFKNKNWYRTNTRLFQGDVCPEKLQWGQQGAGFFRPNFLSPGSECRSFHFLTLLICILSIFQFISSNFFEAPRKKAEDYNVSGNKINYKTALLGRKSKQRRYVRKRGGGRSPEAKQWLFSTHHQLPMDGAAITINKFYTEWKSQWKLSVFLQAVQYDAY